MKKRSLKKTHLLPSTLLSLMMILSLVSAANAETAVPHVFFPDTPAKAEEVNENFKTLSDAINHNAAALSSVGSGSSGSVPVLAPAGSQLKITAAEPNLSSLTNPTLLISGKNFSTTASFTGSVSLYRPILGEVDLSVLGFDLAKQEILVGLPVGIEVTPGTLLLKVANATQSDELNVAIGSVGPKGEQGDTGPTGQTGAKGEQGAQGLLGLKGEPGLVGATGATGSIGSTGAKGATGTTGARGVRGATGPMGVSPFGLNGNDAVYNLGKVGMAR